MNILLFKILNMTLNILIWVALWNLLSEFVDFLEIYFDSKFLSNIIVVLVAFILINFINNGLVYRYSFYN